MKTIALVGTFDSKGKEFQFAKTLIEKIGFKTFTIHAGTFDPLFEPDISNEEVAQAGGMPLAGAGYAPQAESYAAKAPMKSGLALQREVLRARRMLGSNVSFASALESILLKVSEEYHTWSW